MEVQVRLGGVAGVAYQPEHLTFSDAVANAHAQRAGSQVRIERVASLTDVEDDEVPANGFESDRNRARRRSGNVFGNAVLHDGDDAIGDGDRVRAVGVVALVLE